MVQSEFQENTKMLMVPTNNIIDKKYCRIITRTSQCNSRNSFTKIFFPVKKQVPRLGYSSWFKVNFKNAHGSYKQHF